MEVDAERGADSCRKIEGQVSKVVGRDKANLGWVIDVEDLDQG